MGRLGGYRTNWGLSMLKQLFIDHPASVDESYVEHAQVAAGFAVKLLYAGMACMVHAIIPGLCKTTGSRTIIDLHRTMVTNRNRKHAAEMTYDVRAFDAVI